MAPNYDDMDSEEEDSVEEEVVAKKRRTKKWKDPNKPKRAMSAFFIYSQATRETVKQENPGATFGDIARILAKQFKELSPKELAKWEKRAEQDKVRYQDEMKDYIPAEDPTGGKGGKKAKGKKDPNAPKKNMSAYFLYSIQARPQVKADNPDASFGDIARLISANFKALSDKERKVWEQKAAADKERYEREVEAYNG